jgi:hypothetical protein
MKKTIALLLLSVVAITQTVTAVKQRSMPTKASSKSVYTLGEIRNDSENAYKASYKNTDHTGSFIHYTFDIDAQSTTPTEIAIPVQTTTGEIISPLFSDAYISVEQSRPEGWVGGSHYTLFMQPETHSITLSKQSGSIYYKNWPQPVVYTFAKKAVRLIIHDDGSVTLEEIKVNPKALSKKLRSRK